MNKKTIEDVSISIITKLFERYTSNKLDDLEFIPFIKSVIQGAIECAEEHDIHERQVGMIKDTLYLYSQSAYVQYWLLHGEEGEDIEQASLDGAEWFDYIYENEKRPK